MLALPWPRFIPWLEKWDPASSCHRPQLPHSHPRSILQLKGSALWDCPAHRPTSDANFKLTLLPGIQTKQLQIGGSNDPLLGSDYLLGWFTEFRETFYLVGFRFIIEGYNSGTARWKRCIGWSLEGSQAQNSYSSGVQCPSWPVGMFVFTKKLSEPHPFSFLEALWFRHHWLNH